MVQLNSHLDLVSNDQWYVVQRLWSSYMKAVNYGAPTLVWVQYVLADDPHNSWSRRL